MNSENIKRSYYLDKIRPFIGKKLIKVLVGQRRVGKSYILLQIINEIKQNDKKANIIFIDKEKYEFDNIKDYSDLIQYVDDKKTKGLNCLFIDEIQEIIGFEKALRSLLSEGFDIYCTGSNAKMLSGELSTFLSGRQIEIKIYSLNFIEFCQFNKLLATNETVNRYIKYGGLPYLMHLTENDEVISDYLKNIYATILFKDVVKRYEIRDVQFLQDLIKYLADNVGNIMSATNISKYLKSQKINKSIPAILSYISYLNDAYITFKVHRTDVKGKKIFEIGEKIYFEDVGIRNAINGYRTEDISKIIENVIFHHLISFGYTVYVGKLDENEIDFVAERNNERVYIQAAYLLNSVSVIDREFGNLMKIKDQYPKYVVTMDDYLSVNTHKGIMHLSLLDFLTKFN